MSAEVYLIFCFHQVFKAKGFICVINFKEVDKSIVNLKYCVASYF